MYFINQFYENYLQVQTVSMGSRYHQIYKGYKQFRMNRNGLNVLC